KAATRKNWTVPGFAQTSEQPVVCISWNDAAAYVQWLSAQKGQHYRLPSSTDWHATGAISGGTSVAGAYSEWLQNCGAGCQSHLVAARGGATGSGREAGQGYDDVGFRVVRILDVHR
ncbi:MAG TPA: SUMF1/EgtB/PvdO family nonheme iron enzyme, partial [Xanthomonadaceae bacterium]|nr:SUMF1/EgtB/PvdO family nonheme iron enzyme [Xanthomonadaceae bacterium]